MIGDVWTVMWKELKEMMASGGGTRSRGKFGLLLILGVFGVVIPLQAGREWVTSPIAMLVWGWLPFMLVSGVIADSFAGERERHTLETLLASRLSDRAILFGKLAAGVAYGCGLVWAMAVLGLVTINVAFGAGELVLYSPGIAQGIVIFALLASGLAASAGVLISLRASTVRQAQQTFSVALLLLFVPVFVLRFLPEDLQYRLYLLLQDVDMSQVALIAGAAVAVLDAGLVAAAMARFRRARLILD